MKIQVKVFPNSKQPSSILQSPEGVYEIRVRAIAADGKANLAAVECLADYFGVSKRQICLLRGKTSRYKTFEIEGI